MDYICNSDFIFFIVGLKHRITKFKVVYALACCRFVQILCYSGQILKIDFYFQKLILVFVINKQTYSKNGKYISDHYISIN